MSTLDTKKITIQIPADLFKTAKLQAQQQEQTLNDWLLQLINQAIIRSAPATSASNISAADWGRIDSRIDQRMTNLERRVELLTEQLNILSVNPSHPSELHRISSMTPIHLSVTSVTAEQAS